MQNYDINSWFIAVSIDFSLEKFFLKSLRSKIRNLQSDNVSRYTMLQAANQKYSQ